VNIAAWMLFVDGENFTIRAQELAKQKALSLVRIRRTTCRMPSSGYLNGTRSEGLAIRVLFRLRIYSVPAPTTQASLATTLRSTASGIVCAH